MLKWNDYALQAVFAAGFLTIGWTVGVTHTNGSWATYFSEFQILIGAFVAIVAAAIAYAAARHQSLISIMMSDSERMKSELPGLKQIDGFLYEVNLNLQPAFHPREYHDVLETFDMTNGKDLEVVLENRLPFASSFDVQQVRGALRLLVDRIRQLQEAEYLPDTVGESSTRLLVEELESQLQKMQQRIDEKVRIYEVRIPKADAYLSRFYDDI